MGILSKSEQESLSRLDQDRMFYRLIRGAGDTHYWEPLQAGLGEWTAPDGSHFKLDPRGNEVAIIGCPQDDKHWVVRVRKC